MTPRRMIISFLPNHREWSGKEGLGWPSCGRSAGEWHCRRAGRPTHRENRRLRSCWGDVSSPASTGGGSLALSSLEHMETFVCVRAFPIKRSSFWLLRFVGNPLVWRSDVATVGSDDDEQISKVQRAKWLHAPLHKPFIFTEKLSQSPFYFAGIRA